MIIIYKILHIPKVKPAKLNTKKFRIDHGIIHSPCSFLFLPILIYKHVSYL